MAVGRRARKAAPAWLLAACVWLTGGCPRAGTGTDEPTTASAKSGTCDGARLAEGKCECSHTRCFDLCCPAGYVCVHPSRPGGWSKCMRVP